MPTPCARPSVRSTCGMGDSRVRLGGAQVTPRVPGATDDVRSLRAAQRGDAIAGAAEHRVEAELATTLPTIADAVVEAGGSFTLTIMVGGDAADLQTIRPIFDALGNKVFHCGPLDRDDMVRRDRTE